MTVLLLCRCSKELKIIFRWKRMLANSNYSCHLFPYQIKKLSFFLFYSWVLYISMLLLNLRQIFILNLLKSPTFIHIGLGCKSMKLIHASNEQWRRQFLKQRNGMFILKNLFVFYINKKFIKHKWRTWDIKIMHIWLGVHCDCRSFAFLHFSLHEFIFFFCSFCCFMLIKHQQRVYLEN